MIISVYRLEFRLALKSDLQTGVSFLNSNWLSSLFCSKWYLLDV